MSLLADNDLGLIFPTESLTVCTSPVWSWINGVPPFVFGVQYNLTSDGRAYNYVHPVGSARQYGWLINIPASTGFYATITDSTNATGGSVLFGVSDGPDHSCLPGFNPSTVWRPSYITVMESSTVSVGANSVNTSPAPSVSSGIGHLLNTSGSATPTSFSSSTSNDPSHTSSNSTSTISGSNTPPSENTSPHPSSHHTGAIVGAVIGGAAFLGLIFYMLHAYLKRRKRMGSDATRSSLDNDAVQPVRDESTRQIRPVTLITPFTTMRETDVAGQPPAHPSMPSKVRQMRQAELERQLEAAQAALHTSESEQRTSREAVPSEEARTLRDQMSELQAEVHQLRAEHRALAAADVTSLPAYEGPSRDRHSDHLLPTSPSRNSVLSESSVTPTAIKSP